MGLILKEGFKLLMKKISWVLRGVGPASLPITELLSVRQVIVQDLTRRSSHHYQTLLRAIQMLLFGDRIRTDTISRN